MRLNPQPATIFYVHFFDHHHHYYYGYEISQLQPATAHSIFILDKGKRGREQVSLRLLFILFLVGSYSTGEKSKLKMGDREGQQAQEVD